MIRRFLSDPGRTEEPFACSSKTEEIGHELGNNTGVAAGITYCGVVIEKLGGLELAWQTLNEAIRAPRVHALEA